MWTGPVQQTDDVTWRPWRFMEVEVSHAGHLLLLQGLPVYRFFLDARVGEDVGFHVLSFLATPIWRVPYVMREVLAVQFLTAPSRKDALLLLPRLRPLLERSCAVVQTLYV